MPGRYRRKGPGPRANDMVVEGTQYHIGLRKGDIAPNVILCGELERVQKVASFFDSVTLRKQRREFITVTGTWKGIPVSVMGTGIGPDNTEIALIESSALLDRKKAVYIRVGSCGTLQPHIKLGDAVISTGSVRFENTSLFYVPDGYPAIANFDVVHAMRDEAHARGIRAHQGLTATTSSFYGAQCRSVGFPLADTGLIGRLTEMGVLNLEMETSLLFTLCSLGGMRAGAVCAAYTDRLNDTVIRKEDKPAADRACIEIALGALKRLSGK